MSESPELSDGSMKVVRNLPLRYGRYVLEKRLGAGGMAEVFLASLDLPGGFKKKVVVKRMLPHLAELERNRSMFLREAKVAARLSHPNVVQIFELGEVEGDYFIAMEFIDGLTVRSAALRNWKLSRPFPIDVATRIISDAALGLDYCHRQLDENGKPLGLVHRDISPENLMITTEGVTKILDFGIAKGDESEKLTRTGAIKGKVPYMSPEQVAGLPLDGRSDLWSLGVSLYWLLTSRRPFDREAELLTLNAILKDEPRPPRELRPEIPASLDAVVMKLLAKARSDRIQTGAELHDALVNFVPTAALTTPRFVDEVGAVDERGSGRFYLGLEEENTESPKDVKTRVVGSDDQGAPPRGNASSYGLADSSSLSLLETETRTTAVSSNDASLATAPLDQAALSELSRTRSAPAMSASDIDVTHTDEALRATEELVRRAKLGPRRWPWAAAAFLLVGGAAGVTFLGTHEPSPLTPAAEATTTDSDHPPPVDVVGEPADPAVAPSTESDPASGAVVEPAALQPDRDKGKGRVSGRKGTKARPSPRSSTATEAPLDPPKPALRAVSVAAPDYIQWRDETGRLLTSGSGTVEIATARTSLQLRDPKRKLSSTVQIPEDGRIDYAKLPRGELTFRVLPGGEVYLGSERMGELPFGKPLELVAGTYEVRLVYQGAEKVIPIEVRARRTAVVKHKF